MSKPLELGGILGTMGGPHNFFGRDGNPVAECVTPVSHLSPVRSYRCNQGPEQTVNEASYMFSLLVGGRC